MQYRFRPARLPDVTWRTADEAEPGEPAGVPPPSAKETEGRSMFAWFGVWLASCVCWTAVALTYGIWKRRRRPARHRRLLVLGAAACAVGYAHTLAYGFALTRPRTVCGRRTLDDDYPLSGVRAHAFPPRLECYWSDSSGQGPGHPTAAGGWMMWCGAALLVAGAVAWAVQLRSCAPRWARAGMILAPAAAATIWVARVDRLMGLSAVALDNECFRWQVAHLHSAPAGEIVGADRTLLPPAVDCLFTDGSASLMRPETLGLWCCFLAFLICWATLLRSMAPPALPHRGPR